MINMKQFLRHILLLVALFMTSISAWAADDCTIVETYNDVTAIADGKWHSYKPFGKIVKSKMLYRLNDFASFNKYLD